MVYGKMNIKFNDIANIIDKKNKEFRALHKIDAYVNPKVITKLLGQIKAELKEKLQK